MNEQEDTHTCAIDICEQLATITFPYRDDGRVYLCDYHAGVVVALGLAAWEDKQKREEREP